MEGTFVIKSRLLTKFDRKGAYLRDSSSKIFVNFSGPKSRTPSGSNFANTTFLIESKSREDPSRVEKSVR